MQRQSKAESRPKCVVWLSPQPSVMPLDNGSANRKAHSHPTFFCREKGFENFLTVCQTHSVVLNLDESSGRAILSRTDNDFPGTIGNRIHRVKCVHTQIQNELLNLNSIAECGSQISLQLGFDR